MAARNERCRQIQFGLLPKAPVIPGLSIATHYEPVDSVGGDFYDFVAFPPNRLGVMIADVSGHGVDAAIIMAATKKSLQLIARTGSAPREVLIELARDLSNELPPTSFVSVFYGILDHDNGELVYANAGHNPPLLARSTGQSTELEGRGTVISSRLVSILERDLSEQRVSLERGDTLLLFTDGIVEAATKEGAQFGDERLQQLLAHGRNDEGRLMLQDIWHAVQSHVGDGGMQDDATMLALRLEPRAVETIVLTPLPPTRPAKVAPERMQTNIRPAEHAFIGRDDALAALANWFAGPQPVLSLSGPAGVGKTALVQEFGLRALPAMPYGVHYVDLHRAQSIEECMLRLLAVLGVAEFQSVAPMKVAAEALGLRGPMLLILDGYFEPSDLLSAVAETLSPAQSDARFIVASRRTSKFLGARELKLSPLASPTRAQRRALSSDELKRNEAVVFLLSAISALSPDFSSTDEELRAIAEICEVLEGHPVSLQLAAGRFIELGGQALAEQLRANTQKLRLLRNLQGQEALQTLEDSIQWSVQCLPTAEGKLLAQLSVFADGCMLDCAQTVLETGDAGLSVTELLGSLVERG